MRINTLLLGVTMSVGLLASCSSESVAPDSSSPATIKLTLATGSTKTGGASGTAIPSGDGTVANSSADEAKINRVSVITFDGSAGTSKVVTTQEVTSPSTSSANTITTTTAAQYIIVVANAPSGYFSGLTTLSAITAKAADLGYTTSTDGSAAYAVATGVNSQKVTALPMYCAVQQIGTGTLAANSTTAVTANLTRMPARVAITSILTSFENGGAYAGAVFVPKEIFIYNANTTYNWDNTMPATASFQSGESTDASCTILSTLTSYSYLSSGALTPTGYTPTTAYSSTATEQAYLRDGTYTTSTDNPYYFYVFPNSTSTASSTTYATKLVIKGLWTFGGTTSTMYYPILINHAQTGTTITGTPGTDTQLTPNTRYSIKAVIRSIGVTSPASQIDPASVSLTLTVNAWASAQQTTVFN